MYTLIYLYDGVQKKTYKIKTVRLRDQGTTQVFHCSSLKMMRLRKEVGRKASAFKNTAMSEGERKEVGRKRRKDWRLSVSEGPRYSHDSAQNLVVVFFV